MESIYRDAYPDVFVTCDFDFELLRLDVAMQRLEDSDRCEKKSKEGEDYVGKIQ